MRRIRSKGMKPEMVVRRMVHAMGYRFRLHDEDLPGKPDLVFASRGKIIDVRGCFWHQHRGCPDAHVPRSNVGYWGAKLLGNQARDRKNAAHWRRLGWKSLCVWECETLDAGKLSVKLRRFLES